MFALFAFGTLGFWLFFTVAVIAVVIAVEFRKSFLSGFFILLSLAFLDIVGHIPVSSYILHHPLSALYMALGYVAVGTVWAVVKWYLYLRKSYHWVIETRDAWAKKQGFSGYAEFNAKEAPGSDDRQSLERQIKHSQHYNPKVSDHKSSILFWMSYWPFSVAGALLTDFFRSIFNRVYMEIAAFLQRMSDRMFAGVRGEVEVPKHEADEFRKKAQEKADADRKQRLDSENAEYERRRGVNRAGGIHTSI
jgi:hypothetical protein